MILFEMTRDVLSFATTPKFRLHLLPLSSTGHPLGLIPINSKWLQQMQHDVKRLSSMCVLVFVLGVYQHLNLKQDQHKLAGMADASGGNLMLSPSYRTFCAMCLCVCILWHLANVPLTSGSCGRDVY